MRKLLLGVASALLACGSHPRGEGCQKDTDCKADRVCVAQACVEPEPGASNSKTSESDAQADKEKVEQIAEQVRKDAAAAQGQVEKLQRDLADLDAKTTKAIDAVIAAQNDADRATAKARLFQLQKEKQDIEARIATAKAQAAHAERIKGVTIRRECIDNPLSKGC